MKIQVAICLIAIANTIVATSAAGTSVFDYGIASRGPINLADNAKILSANNDPAEASVLSGTYSNPTITMCGDASIQGDVFVSNPAGQVLLTGTVSIGGKSGSDPAIYDHIHLGIGNVQFPEINPTVFEPFATRIVDSHTNFSGGPFDNIRIKAGTNPSFGNNVSVRGVMYVESPNYVSFGNNIDFRGVIVTQDPGAGADPALHTIYFNNMHMRGVEELPDTSDFHVLRGMGGTAILAPGFTVQFKNNFLTCTTQGTILADRLIAGENLTASVCGSIITMNGGVQLDNNARITITLDQSRYGGAAPGVTTGGPVTLARMPDTYCEGS